MRLLIAMPGPRAPLPGSVDAEAGVQPALPGLTHLLKRARAVPAVGDWRQGLLSQLDTAASRAKAASGGVAAVDPVAVAARVLPAIATGTSLCFAAPLHVIAGISRVHLPPGGWLTPEPTEDQAWREAFNATFAADGVRLHGTASPGHWLLEAPFAHATRDADPGALVGEPLERQAAADASQRSLRRLGAEAEMWLADHALNRARELRRQPVVNALWFWDGGRSAPLPAWRAPAMLVSNLPADAWLQGLGAQLQQAVRQASDWQSLAASAGAGESLALVLRPDAGGASGQYWQMLEDEWFAPITQALQAGAVQSIHLRIGRGAWEIPDASLLRWLRPGRGAWWQRIAAAQA